MIKTKSCTKCGIKKSINDFYKRLNRPSGTASLCKLCCREDTKSWRNNNKSKLKNDIAIYRATHKDEIKSQVKQYREINKEKLLKQQRDYKQKHKKEILQWMNNYISNKRKNDLQFKLLTNLRTRIHTALKQNYKSGHTIELLGCTIPELKNHLEKQFRFGMTWKNYGMFGWHIDHIKPLIKFDLSKKSEQLKACHYSNLQPLWAKENIIKSDNY